MTYVTQIKIFLTSNFIRWYLVTIKMLSSDNIMKIIFI